MDHRRKKPTAIYHHRMLNDDVLTEILLTLPVRSILRFKAVCKSWRHIIDSPIFRKSYIANQSNNGNDCDDDDTVFLQFYFGGTVFLQFSFGEQHIWKLSVMLPENNTLYEDFPALQEFFNNNINSLGMKFTGPVNGLICIHEDRSLGKNGPIAVCNPSLGKIKILPISPLCSSVRKSFQKSRSVGFGFYYVTGDYKVVQLLSCHRDRIYIEIYSKAINTWRELATDTLDQTLCIKRPIKSTYKNGSFAHWWARRRSTGGHYEDVILSFDMHNEVFEMILLPDYENMGICVKSKFFAKDDSFVLFVYSCYNIDISGRDNWLKIYELKSEENKGYWTLVSKVLFQGVPKPIALWKSDGVVLRYYSKKKNLIIFYDYSTKKISVFGMPDNVHRLEIFGYEGSLISP